MRKYTYLRSQFYLFGENRNINLIMFDSINKLNQEEQQILMDALPLVTVLIASADGKIDKSETAWAEKLADIRSYSNEPDLNEYYEKVSEHFAERVSWFISELPEDTDAGIQMISKKLEGLNEVLPKLPQELGAKFYKSFTSFAKHIARADGGFLKMWSISKEEAALIDLPMINEISMPEEEED